MFSEGHLLYFDPFKFHNGTQKPKFFVVLKHDGNGLLLASLPTSKDHIPSDMPVRQGCYEHPEKNINVYVFMAGQSVAMHPETQETFCFDKNTFVYGADINTYPVAEFEEQSRLGEMKIILKGKMEAGLFDDLRDCLKKSACVKNKFKRIL